MNGNCSAYGSTKKSNGLITARSATSPTVISSSSALAGNTARATWLPNGSCCQLRKCSAGLICSVYDSIGVRVCGAGRSRIVCGPIPIGRSNR